MHIIAIQRCPKSPELVDVVMKESVWTNCLKDSDILYNGEDDVDVDLMNAELTLFIHPSIRSFIHSSILDTSPS